MKTQGSDSAEDTIKKLDEQLRKYKYMEINLLSKKKRYVFEYNLYYILYIQNRVIIIKTCVSHKL